MAWSTSKIFRQYIADVLANTTAMDLHGTDTLKAALYNNTAAPDGDVTAANSAFGAGTWSGNEVTGTNWAAGGQSLASPVVSVATSATVMFDAADVSVATVTVSNAYGTLVYDNSIATPVSKQGICFNYFGGAQSVTAGTFTIVWSASGIFSLSL